jgi:hypothetical protein
MASRPLTKTEKPPTGKRPVPFSVPDVRKALKLATEMGLPLAGYEITPEGGLRVHFATGAASSADAALSAWQRGRGDG